MRLTRKFAQVLNGIDLSDVNAGDVIDLPDRQARLLLDEQWAVRASDPRIAASDAPPKRKRSPKAR